MSLPRRSLLTLILVGPFARVLGVWGPGPSLRTNPYISLDYVRRLEASVIADEIPLLFDQIDRRYEAIYRERYGTQRRDVWGRSQRGCGG